MMRTQIFEPLFWQRLGALKNDSKQGEKIVTFIVPTTRPAAKPVPGGNYRAKLDSLENLGQQPNPHKPGMTHWRALATFKIKTPLGVMDQRMYLTVSFHKKATLPRLLRTLGVGWTPPADADLEQMVGKICNVTIEEYLGEDGGGRSKITDFWPDGAAAPAPSGNVHGVDIGNSDVPF